ncbi:carboxymuconolactone decarboxylase family protein [Paraburkholderia phymatum]|uniref:carboxymuconolactone decarboxylase family protein n=1 Tax=Paraburkholderia phymatum TaxID=148447 RepID=UPI00317384A8
MNTRRVIPVVDDESIIRSRETYHTRVSLCRELNMFDMSNLNRLQKLEDHAPAGIAAFWAFDKAAFEEGALSVQTKQLIAVAVALTTQCPYCIELHTTAARNAGATNAQLAETAVVAAAICAGGAITHATHLMQE